MKTLKIREFTRNFYKYLKLKEDIVVTNKGNESFRVIFCRDNKPIEGEDVVTKVATSPNVVTLENIKPKLEKVIESKPEDDRFSHYACGCKKEDKYPLCSTHQRY